uniref:peptidoglycan-binding protein n=1 Tax=Yoonia sp. TaxID=2212373 RepID=UPI00404810C9
MIRVLLAWLIITFPSLPALAQSTVWVQIEAQPTLAAAQGRARAYAGQLDDVAGYFVGGRWYAVVLGPYAPADAEAVLRQLRSSGQIPGDSFIADGARFRQQFYPVGVGAQTTPQPLPAAQAVATGAPDHEHPVEPEELMREEAGVDGLLDGSERRALQSALRFAGVYDGPVDGMIGRATRAAIRTWQQARGEEPNGALNIS